MPTNVRLGLVPSFRFTWTPWTQQMRDETLAVMAATRGVEVVVPSPSTDGRADAGAGITPYGAVQTLDQAEAVAGYFAQQKIDGLVICPTDFGDERSACKVAELLQVPTLLLATKEPPAPPSASLERVSDSYCGTLSIAAGLLRRRIAFHYAGLYFPTEPELAADLDAFARAVAVAKGLRNARIGQVGTRPAAFETVAYDEIAMARKFGQTVVPVNLEDIVDDAKAMADDDPKVRAVIADIRQTIPHITVADDYLLKAAKLETALLAFAEENRIVAMGVQCWPTVFRTLGISLCAIYGRLTQQHLLTACETDVLGAVSMLVSDLAAMGETVPHFIDWTIRHREDPNCLLAWHCGNAPPCLARTPGERALRSRANMTGELPVEPGDHMAGLAQFQLKPGPVTICRLVEYEGEWKMLIAAGEIVPSDETLAGTWAWVRVPDHDRLYRVLVEEGFIHHASMAHGDHVQALMLACKFLGIRPVRVG